MKRNRRLLSAAAALLATAGLVAGGILIPKALLQQTRAGMLNAMGAVEVEALTPYSSETELVSRVRKLTTMLQTANNYDIEPYLAQRSTLDSELSESEAREKGRSFLQSVLEKMYEANLEYPMMLLMNQYVWELTEQYLDLTDELEQYAASGTDSESSAKASDSDDADSAEACAQMSQQELDQQRKAIFLDLMQSVDIDDPKSLLGDLTQNGNMGSQLLCSPENDTLSIWTLEWWFEGFGNVGLCLDAVTGVPLYLYLDTGEVSSSGDYWNTVAESLRELDSDNFAFGSYEEVSESGVNDATLEDEASVEGTTSDGESIDASICYFTGSAGKLHLELEELLYEDHVTELVFWLYG